MSGYPIRQLIVQCVTYSIVILAVLVRDKARTSRYIEVVARPTSVDFSRPCFYGFQEKQLRTALHPRHDGSVYVLESNF